MRTFAWVSPKRDAFVLEFAGGQVFIGRGPKAAEVRNVDGWGHEQVELELPLTQGAMQMNANGGSAKGCEIPQKDMSLGGPIARNVRIDARKGWHFEIRDRSLKKLIQRF